MIAVMGTGEKKLKRAVLWEPTAEGNTVKCNLCRWGCVLADGKVGRCFVRKNIGGVLYSLNYGNVCAANVDPIEKKPLFHFQPGSKSFSVACTGCNFRCVFCQNWQISQATLESGQLQGQPLTCEQIVSSAVSSGCKSMAYTYTEPTVFMELCDECGRLAKEKGLANVFVSNGYESREAIDFVKGWLDGINIDLKAFSNDFYRRLCKAKLEPVLDTIRYVANQTDIWLEITTLIVPGENDSDEELRKIADFIANETNVDVPWHISRFYPNYELDDKGPTQIETLERAVEIGKEAGLRYIYVGNVPGSKGESTFCYNCSEMLIKRVGYTIVKNVMQMGCCPQCGTKIAGFDI